jgi:portal protein
MGLLDKMAARRDGEKAWSQPPSWALDGLTGPMWTTGLTSDKERIEPNYPSYIEQAFKASPAVFAAIRFRMAVLSEARFQWRKFTKGRPGELFGSTELALLERPWPNGTTGDLLARMEVVSSLSGNYFATVADDQGRLGRSARGERRIVHMRPDWVSMVIDSRSGDPNALDAKVVGFLYEPITSSGTAFGGSRPPAVTLLPDEVVHFAPIPDPAARFRGMSWLTPAIEEVRADKAATTHKSKFFTNGASPQLAVTLSEAVSPEDFKAYVAAFKVAHEGADKAYKTLFLAGGADVRPLSSDFRQMDFRPLQQLSETRVAMAAGVHPTVLGMSEGLQGSSLNAGNFNSAARLTANTTLRPWWRNACASLQPLLVPPSGGAELWYDDSRISFLYDDATDLAEIRAKNAVALRQLLDAGYKPDAAAEYLRTDDLGRLIGQHSGLFSVQLQPPGSTAAPTDRPDGPAEPTEPAPEQDSTDVPGGAHGDAD